MAKLYRVIAALVLAVAFLASAAAPAAAEAGITWEVLPSLSDNITWEE